MGKRSSFERVARDFYRTPTAAVVPLLPHLPAQFSFAEPFCGEMDLVDAIQLLSDGTAAWVSDIEDRTNTGQVTCDAMTVTCENTHGCDLVITNSPWPAKFKQGEPVIGFIHHFAKMKPTWLLLSADFAHNVYFNKVADMCVKIVSVGRVSWAGNGVSGKDNVAWYLFDANHTGAIEFVGRHAAVGVDDLLG